MTEKEGKGKSVAEKVDSLGLNLRTLHMLTEVSLVEDNKVETPSPSWGGQ